MRRGRFEQAEGGTLFLDEIGDMPPELQTRLLRVLSDGHFYRVGGHSPLRADVRVIAATHQALEARVRQGLFREDLFHRLNVIRLRLPALRERPEDVPLLARHFLSTSSRSLGTDPKRLTDAALNLLARFSWPGNVRQLENVCHWLNVMAPAQTVDVGDLPPEIRELLSGDAQERESVTSHVNGFHDEGGRDVEGLGESPVGVSVPAGASHEVSIDEIAGHEIRDFDEIHAGLSADGRSTNDLGGHLGGVGGSGASAGAGSGSVSVSVMAPGRWGIQLERELDSLLNAQCLEGDPPEHSDLMDRLVREFETTLLTTALRHTRGRRIEAAQRLGIGRNTITRKIKELGIGD
jgi:two-component system nitrogen regulation response regulator GlnG